MDIKKVIVQGDLVFIHGHGVRGAQDELQWELFRVKAGKIVEIWNTHEVIPPGGVEQEW